VKHEPTTDELPIGGQGKPSEAQTTELPVARHRPETAQTKRAHHSPRRKGRFWAELTGALAAGTVLLAVVVLVLQVLAWVKGMPGLGVWILIGHLVGAGLMIAAQRIVDRREGGPALLAGLGAGAVVVAILVLFWWI
jgi:4-hydroxybenzoate polyprenyltransferase